MHNRLEYIDSIEEYRKDANEYWKYKSQDVRESEIKIILNDIQKAAISGMPIKYKFRYKECSSPEQLDSLKRVAMKHMAARIIEAFDNGYNVNCISDATNNFEIVYRLMIIQNNEEVKNISSDKTLNEVENGLINGFDNVINFREHTRGSLNRFRKVC